MLSAQNRATNECFARHDLYLLILVIHPGFKLQCFEEMRLREVM